jgi:hypothetical protein
MILKSWQNWFFFAFVAGLFLSSCEDNPVKKVDISKTTISYSSSRFDRELFGADFNQPEVARQQLYTKYGTFLCDYMEVILQIAPCIPDTNFRALEGFVRYPDMVVLQNEITRKFPDAAIAGFDEEFEQALRHWHFHFPDSLVPAVAYMNSGFNFSAFSTDSIMAVGLDFFLGKDDSITSLLAPELFPNYFKEDMEPRYLVANVVKDFCWHQLNKREKNPAKAQLIEILVHQGKVMYLCDALLPEVEDSIKMNWSTPQMEWTEEHTFDVWKVLATDEVLFDRSPSENRKWIDFGPFTNVPSIPAASPPQLGIWMGWQMVRAYMKANPTTTMQELLSISDPAVILKAYKPAR